MKNTYKITEKYNIVSEYLQNQQENKWYEMLVKIMELELTDEWEDDQKGRIRMCKIMFERMAQATKEITE